MTEFDKAEVLDSPHEIGMYRLNVLLSRCKMEAKPNGLKFRINTCASVRREFQIPGRTRQQVVDFLEEHIHNIEVTGTLVDHYGHIAESPKTSPTSSQ
jgi:hypothetical protein